MRTINRELQEQKLALARKASAFLVAHVPTVRAVGLTGSVAWGDVSEDDDLDFLHNYRKKSAVDYKIVVLYLGNYFAEKARE